MYIYIYIWNGHPYTQSHTMPRDDSTSMNIERDRELLYMGCIFCNGSICDIYILCFDCVLFLVRVSIHVSCVRSLHHVPFTFIFICVSGEGSFY